MCFHAGYLRQIGECADMFCNLRGIVDELAIESAREREREKGGNEMEININQSNQYIPLSSTEIVTKNTPTLKA